MCDYKRIIIWGWRRCISIYINKTDTVKMLKTKFSNKIGIPKNSYLSITKSFITPKDDIKMLDENKCLFDYGIVENDIITVISPILVYMNNIYVAKIYMDNLDTVDDLIHNLLLIGTVDNELEFELRSDHKKCEATYTRLRNVFKSLKLRIYITYLSNTTNTQSTPDLYGT